LIPAKKIFGAFTYVLSQLVKDYLEEDGALDEGLNKF